MGTPTGEFAAATEAAKRKPGRPPGPAKVTRRNILAAQKMFQAYAEEAMLKIVDIMRDDDADHAVRLKAANDLLNRAYGTPVSTQVQHKIIEDDRESPINPQALTGAATRDLEQLAQTLARFIESERNTIEVNPEMPDNYPRE
jgi:hypothetical protein